MRAAVGVARILRLASWAAASGALALLREGRGVRLGSVTTTNGACARGPHHRHRGVVDGAGIDLFCVFVRLVSEDYVRFLTSDYLPNAPSRSKNSSETANVHGRNSVPIEMGAAKKARWFKPGAICAAVTMKRLTKNETHPSSATMRSVPRKEAGTTNAL